MTLDFRAERTVGTFDYQAEFSATDEILVLFGHSGAGKSLTLQFVAGLLKPREGRIEIAGDLVFDSAQKVNLPPQRRSVGYVVQELALFDHLTVGDNIAFGIPAGRDKKSRVAELLALLDLQGYEKRRPRTLSGGQRQRVALARAIAREAPLLLLDEPFSALDESLRNAMRKELLRLRRELNLTILFVTHDLREAHFLADRIAVFDNGGVLQLDTREEVFKRPVSRRVAQLTGVGNIWGGTVARATGDEVVVSVEGAEFVATIPGALFSPGQAVDVLVRAERINVLRETASPVAGEANVFAVDVVSEFAYGSTHTLHLRPKHGPEMEVEIAARPYEVLGLAQRRTLTARIDVGDVHVVPAEAG